MKKLWLSIALLSTFIPLSINISANAAVKKSNRIIWNKSAKTFDHDLTKKLDSMVPEYTSPGLMMVPHYSEKRMTHSKVVLYRTSKHGKYLIYKGKKTWKYMSSLTVEHLATVRRVAKIKRPAIFYEISYHTKHGTKSYWVWNGYVSSLRIIDVNYQSGWATIPYLAEHPDIYK